MKKEQGIEIESQALQRAMLKKEETKSRNRFILTFQTKINKRNSLLLHLIPEIKDQQNR